ncbi:MAG: glycosyltransferase [Luteitalea sp.]|nr:glycosyltransferase [Luteitalea sp.]
MRHRHHGAHRWPLVAPGAVRLGVRGGCPDSAYPGLPDHHWGVWKHAPAGLPCGWTPRHRDRDPGRWYQPHRAPSSRARAAVRPGRCGAHALDCRDHAPGADTRLLPMDLARADAPPVDQRNGSRGARALSGGDRQLGAPAADGRGGEMRSRTGRRLTIFIAHPSELLTDHRPHGDGLVSFAFLSRLAERGHELHVAAQVVDVLAALPANFHVYELLPGSRLSIWDRLRFMVRMRVLFARLRARVSFDVIHQMNPVFTGMSLVFIGVRTPIVLGTFVPTWQSEADRLDLGRRKRSGVKAMILSGLARLQQARAAGLLIASPAARSRIAQPSRHEGRIFEVPHGIDLTGFPERRAVPARPSVLFLTSVIYRKGIFTLLDAFGEVARAVPDVTLVIAGPGEQWEEVRARVAEMNDGRIRLLGPVDRRDVPALMQAHSVYCLPSYGEPLATSLLEAMACGVPIVATSTGGTPFLLDEAGARLVPPRDPRRLAAALIEVLTSPALQRSMGRHNRRRVEDEFEIERAVDRLEEAYTAVLRADARPSASRGGVNGPGRRTEPVQHGLSVSGRADHDMRL